MKQKYPHGGTRPDSGAKLKTSEPLDKQMRVSVSEKKLLNHIRENKIDPNSLIKKAPE